MWHETKNNSFCLLSLQATNNLDVFFCYYVSFLDLNRKLIIVL